MPGFPLLHYLLEFAQTQVHWVSDATQPSHPLSLPSPSALNLSQHQGFFQWVRLCIRWPKYWSFSFSISPSNEYSGLISFRIDWFDLFSVQVTLKSLLQHHNLKASILWYTVYNRVLETQPDLFTDCTEETGFTGNQESPLLKCFSDCAPTIRKQVRKVLGNPSTHYERHYFAGRLSSLIVGSNDLKA